MSLLQRRSMLGLLAASALIRPGWAETVKDSAGRSVAAPEKAKRILAAGPPAAILVYAVAPEALIGWVAQPGDEAKPFLLPQIRDLPSSGRLTLRGQEPDFDRIGKLKPDLIVDFGSVNPSYVTLADKVQNGAGLPYALLDGRLDQLPMSLRLAGNLTGRQERGQQLAAYAEQTLAKIDAVLGHVPENRRPRFYLARGGDGLQSGVKGSGITEVLERAGGINVAEGPAERGGAIAPTFDQVSAWKPDIIVTFDKAAADAVRTNPDWKRLTANRRVLVAPTLPWGWLGEPPSLNQLLGLRWLSSALHPAEPKMDLVSEAREFHRLFYGVTPTDAQLALLIDAAR